MPQLSLPLALAVQQPPASILAESNVSLLIRACERCVFVFVRDRIRFAYVFVIENSHILITLVAFEATVLTHTKNRTPGEIVNFIVTSVTTGNKSKVSHRYVDIFNCDFRHGVFFHFATDCYRRHFFSLSWWSRLTNVLVLRNVCVCVMGRVRLSLVRCGGLFSLRSKCSPSVPSAYFCVCVRSHRIKAHRERRHPMRSIIDSIYHLVVDVADAMRCGLFTAKVVQIRLRGNALVILWSYRSTIRKLR